MSFALAAASADRRREMVTASHSKSRVSRQEWREDRREVRRAIDPTAWETRHTVVQKPRSAFAAFGSRGELSHVSVDGSALVETLHSLGVRHPVAIDVSALVVSGQWDWEDADSYDRRTLELVRGLLKSLAFIARDTFGYLLDVPHPAPADEGSIDVFFEGGERNLLINIPQGDELVTYFGSDRSGTTFGGSLSRRGSDRDLMTLGAWIMGIR